MMHETVEEKLDRFRIFISGQIQKALAQPNLKDQGIRAKILLCSIIDYMSKSGRLLAVHSSISKDTICEEVKKLWPKENGNLLKLNGIRMDKFCHKNLLWCYRNFLMHEYRNPGRGVEGKNDNKPFYQELKL